MTTTNSKNDRAELEFDPNSEASTLPGRHFAAFARHVNPTLTVEQSEVLQRWYAPNPEAEIAASDAAFQVICTSVYADDDEGSAYIVRGQGVFNGESRSIDILTCPSPKRGYHWMTMIVRNESESFAFRSPIKIRLAEINQIMIDHKMQICVSDSRESESWDVHPPFDGCKDIANTDCPNCGPDGFLLPWPGKKGAMVAVCEECSGEFQATGL